MDKFCAAFGKQVIRDQHILVQCRNEEESLLLVKSLNDAYEKWRKRIENPAPLCFVVEGSGQFPDDMLRYDCCYPASEEDAHTMQYHSHLPTRKIRLCKPGGGRPSVMRWKSFGWSVIDSYGGQFQLELEE